MITRSLLTAAAVGCAFASTSGLSAQTAEAPASPERHARWELVVPSGTLVPTGALRNAIKRGNMTAAQLSYVVRPSLAVAATVGWTRSRDIAVVGTTETTRPPTGDAMTTRALFTAAVTLSCTLAPASALSAQTAEPRWELHVPTGTVLPTGAQREAIRRGTMNAVQLAYVARSALAVTATLGWARTRDVASADAPKLGLFTYDVGAELRAPRWRWGYTVTFYPFAGVGAGARCYDYRSLDVDATHNLAAYAAVGGELGVRRVRLRLEARDYVTGFRPLAGGGPSATRNDVVVMAGLRFVRRGR
jgi:hypothetical protein